MTDGEAIGLAVVGVGVLGAGAWLLLRPPAVAAGVMSAGAYPYTATMAPTALGAPPAAPSAASQLMSGINGLNQAGCQAAAQKVGAGGLAAIGCSEFLKYATPLGIAQFANTEIEKIPVVGSAVKKTEHAVAAVVSKPISVVKNFITSIF